MTLGRSMKGIMAMKRNRIILGASTLALALAFGGIPSVPTRAADSHSTAAAKPSTVPSVVRAPTDVPAPLARTQPEEVAEVLQSWLKEE